MEIKKNNLVIGILGGGQLAKMSLLAAAQLGFECAILEKQSASPAGKHTRFEFTGQVSDIQVLDSFIHASDVVTLESEFIDPAYLSYIESKGKKVFPSAATLSLIQDKYIQKTTFRDAGVPVAGFVQADGEPGYAQLSAILGEKFLLKSRTMGYDGYGNALVTDEESLIRGYQKLRSRNSSLMAEEYIPFVKELAVMVVRTGSETVFYPVAETIQEHHICKEVRLPSGITPGQESEVRDMVTRALDAIAGEGIFGFELFLLADGKILVNEVAPRPHNSGHYTIDACVTSQFENHIRAVAGLPLGSPELLKSHVIMVNLLGRRNGPGFPGNYQLPLHDKDVKLHVYGKEESRPGRKMGHITLTGSSDDIYQRASAIEKETDI
ncbi:MAG: N5-carboxyaminoimidazole ribonucleotide synthase [Ignavibacteriaceae bacterium]|nr:N5-carboxyaminoimidazole ribonucleotide synthase [Ignavibacteriaceae bacterium]